MTFYGAHAFAQNVTVVQTTQNQTTAAFSPTVDTAQPIQNFIPGSASGVNATITVDNTGGYQQVDGFGVNFNDLTSILMANYMNSMQQSSFLQSLFAPTTGYIPSGYGFNLMLAVIGAEDQVYHGCYNDPVGNVSGCGGVIEGTYDDNNGAVDNCLVNGGLPLTNFATPCNFSIINSNHNDLAYLTPDMAKAVGYNAGLHVVASAYWQPNWMMTSESSPCGNPPSGGKTGVMTIAPQHYQTAANYYTKFVQTYESQGIPIWALVPQNEPCQPGSQQVGDLTPTEALNLFKNYVYPTFQAAKLNTQLLPEVDGYSDSNTYALTLMQDPVLAREVLGVAWHDYTGSAVNPSIVATGTITQTNGSAIHVNQYETEYDAGVSTSGASSFNFQALQPMAGLQSGLKTWIWHALANNTADSSGTCNVSNCLPLVNIDTAGNITQLQQSYIIKHFSRYIHPGAYIVPSKSSSTSINAIAARNPDGSTVLVVLNYDEADPNRVIGVNWGGRTFSYTLPSYSMATFLWPGVQSATNVEVDDAATGSGLNTLSYSGSGWIHGSSCGSSTGCYNATLSADSVSGDSVSMQFQGTYVNIYGAVGAGAGTANITVDGGAPVASSEVSSTAAGNTLIYSTPAYAPLSAGATHTLTITNTSGAPFTLDRIEIVTPTTTTVDDSVQGTGSNQFNYVGSGWAHCTNCDSNPAIGRYAASYSSNSTAGDSVSFTYAGYGATLYFATGPAQGYASVTYDANPAVKIDTYSNVATGNQVGWVSPPQTASATHTITLTVAGSHGAYSIGSGVALDGVEFVQTPTVALSLNPAAIKLAPGGSGTSMLTITPVAGFTGSVALACSSLVAYISCSAITPASITGTAPATAMITVSVSSTAELRFPTSNIAKSRTELAFALPLGSMWLALCVRRRKILVTLARRASIVPVLCLFLAGLTFTLSGCGGKSSPSTGSISPPAGTQTITIVATTAAGNVSIPLQVTISN